MKKTMFFIGLLILVAAVVVLWMRKPNRETQAVRQGLAELQAATDPISRYESLGRIAEIDYSKADRRTRGEYLEMLFMLYRDDPVVPIMSLARHRMQGMENAFPAQERQLAELMQAGDSLGLILAAKWGVTNFAADAERILATQVTTNYNDYSPVYPVALLPREERYEARHSLPGIIYLAPEDLALAYLVKIGARPREEILGKYAQAPEIIHNRKPWAKDKVYWYPALMLAGCAPAEKPTMPYSVE
ncbi:MAG: hypothetical protein AB7V22_02015 [Kiritimatiellia bacterium]